MTATRFDAERVLWIRATLGLTQREFAQRYHVNVASVRVWEQGNAVPKRGTIIGKLLTAERDAMKIVAEQENREPPESEEST